MRQDKTLILDRKTIQQHVGIKDAIRVVERAFKEYGLGRVQMPPKIYLHLDRFKGDFRAMPAYIETLGRCALKWVNVHPGNKRFGLPTVMAVIILSDPQSGFPLCIMDGTYATNLRTGAAGAVAAKYLARKNAQIVALVGCGAQARTQLLALQGLFKIKQVRVWGHKDTLIQEFIRQMRKSPYPLVAAKNIKECVLGSDIVVTTTPSRKPLLRLEWIKPGTHINAIGADACGKEELEPAILKAAKVFVDSWEQAAHSGEINVPLRKKLISRRDVFSDIGKVVAGKSKGRTSDKEITVFDSTGLAIQDVAIANLIFEIARKKKLGRWFRLI